MAVGEKLIQLLQVPFTDPLIAASPAARQNLGKQENPLGFGRSAQSSDAVVGRPCTGQAGSERSSVEGATR